MTRNLGTPLAWSWLSNSVISKFCHFSYMFVIFHNFKALLSLLWLSHPTILPTFHHGIFSDWKSLLIIIIIIFLEIGWNYMSIIITVVSNITVLVSTNVFPHLPLPYQVFIRFIYCFTKNAWSTFRCCDQVIFER